jgi:kynurenine formamidase
MARHFTAAGAARMIRAGGASMTRRSGMALCALLSLAAAPAAAGEAAARRVVDLGHAFDEKTVYWPTETARFAWRKLAVGETPGGWFYAAGAFSAPEHGGTHLDAPLHFAAGGESVEQIPLERLVGPAVVIDVRASAARDAAHALSAAELASFEARHGPVEAGAIVLLLTGWDRLWPDARAYLGDDTPGDASKLRFPGYGAEAARVLVEQRRVAGLGVDTASLDPGPSRDFPVHRVAAARGVYGLENLRGLDQLPARGATLVALPMKIAGGTGAPARVIAFLPEAP